MKSRFSSAAALTPVPAANAISVRNNTLAARNRLKLMRLVYHRSSAALPCRRTGAEIFREQPVVDLKCWPRIALLVLASLGVPLAMGAPATPRARDLGVPFDGIPGPNNAITDVAGVTVGHTTLISGSGKLQLGHGPVRTGVTAVLPRGKDSLDPVFGAWFTLNGNGEMTGTTWLEESGFLDGPILITNTHSV